MERAKGWIRRDLLWNEKELPEIDRIKGAYVDEIPVHAVRGETVVKMMPDNILRQQIAVIKLPIHLIGKKVSFIIIPEED